MFKTQKLLRTRALVSDSFSQPNGNYWSAGMAAYHHTDGYNVLYGDWSATWHGDPQQNIMWWPDATPTAKVNNHYFNSMHNLAHNNITDGTVGPSHTSFASGYYASGSSVSVWHRMDVSHGEDVE